MAKRLKIERPQRKNKQTIVSEGVSATGEDYTVSVLDDGTVLIRQANAIPSNSILIAKQADLDALTELLGYLETNNYKID